ncbi:DUF2797 domain-containing protein [Yinghuangia sp. ASG 101]|uniref:DUF2797 domain-containing protein n=1 Tax=Yinghuangia sp. ASG 101 TaxID=2896848 RepID=UPI001E3E6510|nr:DUF2797 domain-containing protein [Yinghuangia sp. ASG 101]UGQ13567.1 DUF2797 domain-containing protein [Yinghuangia sp. ASG 101]
MTKTSGTLPPRWRPTAVRWPDSRPLLVWNQADPTGGESCSPLVLGDEVSFAVDRDRRCVGVWQGNRRLPCAERARLDPWALGALCPRCARVKDSLTAADQLGDATPHRLFLIHHGDAAIALAVTPAERAHQTVLEAGVLASLALYEGTASAVRHTADILRSALRLPDRVRAPLRRAARARPGDAYQRADDLVAARQVALHHWRQFSTPLPKSTPVDHAETYRLPDQGLRPDAELSPLMDTAAVSGRLVCVVGTDLYLENVQRGLVLVDGRRMFGWGMRTALSSLGFTAATRPVADRVAMPPEVPGRLAHRQPG